MCEKYNGWANRETWALVLHLDNDQGLSEEVSDRVAQSLFDGRAEHAVNGLNDSPGVGVLVKAFVEELLLTDELGCNAGWQRDMLYDIGSLYRVDWNEVGAHYLQALSE